MTGMMNNKSRDHDYVFLAVPIPHGNSGAFAYVPNPGGEVFAILPRPGVGHLHLRTPGGDPWAFETQGFEPWSDSDRTR